MGKVRLMFIETALELMPAELQGNGIIRDEAKKRHLKADQILLDSNKHDLPMRGIENAQKRGRPDIIHFSLLTALESIANKRHLISGVFIHTYANQFLSVRPETRLPRIYNRFVGIMEQVLFGGKNQFISCENGVDFENALQKAIGKEKPAIYFFNEDGKKIKMKALLADFEKDLNSASESPILLVFGCFAHGTFSESARKHLLKMDAKEIRFGDDQLTVWTLVSSALNIYEIGCGL